MTTAENKTEDRLWDVSVVSNRSWVELVEEEERELEAAKNRSISSLHASSFNGQVSSSEPDITYNGVNEKSQLKIEPEDDCAQDVEVSSVLNKMPSVDRLPTFGKVSSANSLQKTPVKKEPAEVFQEDISLTGHLDGFKLVSPCKPVGKQNLETANSQSTASFKTPEKCLTPRKSSCSKGSDSPQTLSCKRKLPGVKADDDALMPSPNKISRISTVSTPPQAVVTRKRLRDNLTPTPKRSPTKKKREPETDPEVIARRQKQIDYGKNTIGYERYRKLVPKDSRTKMHPRTPPLNLKFSRRAWDGLVRVWRQRLHFWDPPSEGGGNPECLEVQCEISDCSSTDGSLPSTPVQEWKRQKSSLPGGSPFMISRETFPNHTSGEKKILSGNKFPLKNSDEETCEEYLSQGCTPLPD